MPEFYELIANAAQRGEPFALAILSGVKGSSPQKKGAKALFYPDGRIEGTLGGGCLEAEIQQRARQALLDRRPAQFDLVLDHDFGWDDGLICGGKVSGVVLPAPSTSVALWRELAERSRELTWGVRPDFSIATGRTQETDWLYSETVSPRCGLWIAGAGHVAQAVAPLALRLDFAVMVFDDRPALATHRYFPEGTQFKVDYWDTMLAETLPKRPMFGLIVTRGHQHDALTLRHWLAKPFVFLGMIGSRRKKRLIFDQFVAEGLATREQLNAVACPVGLELLAHSVDEIALSIIAQFVMERGQRVLGRSPKASALGEALSGAPEAIAARGTE